MYAISVTYALQTFWQRNEFGAKNDVWGIWKLGNAQSHFPESLHGFNSSHDQKEGIVGTNEKNVISSVGLLLDDVNVDNDDIH